MNRIRVLHVIARFNRGGTAKYINNLFTQIDNEMFYLALAVGVVEPYEQEEKIEFTFPVYKITSLARKISLISDLKSYYALRKIVRNFKPDIIQSHTFKAGVLARLMYKDIPKIHVYHGHLFDSPEFQGFKSKIIQLIEKFLAHKTSILIATGKTVVNDLLQLGIGDPSNFLSVPGSIGKFVQSSKPAARKLYDLEDKFTVVWAARITSVKNPELLLEIAKLCPNFEFLMCGEGDLINASKSLAPSNVQILGWVNPSQVFAAADVFLSTSHNEGIPYSILEAQLAGLPVIAVNAGSVSEIVNDGVNGLLVPKNAEVIAKVLQELSLNGSKRIEMSNQARKSAERRIKEVNNSETFSVIYQKIYYSNSPKL